MSDFYLHLAKERQAELLHDAVSQRITSARAPREPLVSVRLTFELRLGRRQNRGAAPVLSPDPCP
jgi:hypothetical protein